MSKKLKKYWWVVLFILLIPIIINSSYKTDGIVYNIVIKKPIIESGEVKTDVNGNVVLDKGLFKNPIITMWGAETVLIFYGSFLAFIGAIYLGITAQKQNERLIDINKKQMETVLITQHASIVKFTQVNIREYEDQEKTEIAFFNDSKGDIKKTCNLLFNIYFESSKNNVIQKFTINEMTIIYDGIVFDLAKPPVTYEYKKISREQKSKMMFSHSNADQYVMPTFIEFYTLYDKEPIIPTNIFPHKADKLEFWMDITIQNDFNIESNLTHHFWLEKFRDNWWLPRKDTDLEDTYSVIKDRIVYYEETKEDNQ